MAGERESSAGETPAECHQLTVRFTVVLCVVTPAVPPSVTETVAGLAVDAAVNVSIETPEPLMAAGLNLAVTPVGKPFTDSVIDC
jgi:hypothetical protein